MVERYLGFINVSEKQDVESFSTLITNFFKNNNINEPVVAQSYDGASVMSGRFNGVQQKIKIRYPEAIYIHCMAHRMNLIVLDMCKIVKVCYYIFIIILYAPNIFLKMFIFRIPELYLTALTPYMFIFLIPQIMLYIVRCKIN